MEILKVENVCKTYGKGETLVKALDHVSFSVEKGEFVGIRQMRSHILWYLKGMPSSTEKKRRLQQISSLKELQELLMP